MTPSRYAVFLIAPAACLLGLLTLYPLGRSLILSFFATEYGFDGATFVGTSNYEELASDRFFLRATTNTISFTIMATVSEVSLGLAMALLVHNHPYGRPLIIPLLTAPFVLSTMVVTSIWSAWFHYDFGFLNNLLRLMGLDGQPWLFDPDIALTSLVLVDLWQTAPLAFLLILAGLQSIDDEIYEAARMDGAGTYFVFLTITLPLLAPHLLLAALIRSIDSFKIFDKVFALTGGGPGHATETLSVFLYRQGFQFFEVGMASATAMIMVAIAGALAAIYAARLLARDRDA